MLRSYQPSLRTLDWVASLRAGRSLTGFSQPTIPSFRVSLMARYFSHIKAGADLIKDDEGSEHANLDHARSQALTTARELWADAIKSGKSLDADAIVIADEQG